MKFLYLVWRNLTRKKLRATLTILSILVAFVLFGLLSGLKMALGAGVSLAAEDRMMVRHRVSFINPLPHAYMARIERISGVKAVSHQSWFGGYYQEPRNQIGSFPVDPDRFFELNPEIVVADAEKEAWKQNRTGAIIGRKLAARFNWKIGDRVTLLTMWPMKTGGNWEFDIVGIYDGARKTTDTSGFFFRYDYFDEARAWGTGSVGWYQVTVHDPKKIVDVAAAIDEEFANSQAETKSESEAAMIQGFVQQIGDIGTIVTGILSAVFFTIMLVAGNTMAQSVRERTQEIGVLKALGFSNNLVLGVVLGESLAIAVLGGLLGLLGGVAIVTMLAQVPQLQIYFPVLFVPGRDLLIGAMCAVALGFVAGILPAVQAMRLRLADALRREG
jgi:putative ABC transport system permease protein